MFYFPLVAYGRVLFECLIPGTTGTEAQKANIPLAQRSAWALTP